MQLQDKKHLNFVIWYNLYQRFDSSWQFEHTQQSTKHAPTYNHKYVHQVTSSDTQKTHIKLLTSTINTIIFHKGTLSYYMNHTIIQYLAI